MNTLMLVPRRRRSRKLSIPAMSVAVMPSRLPRRNGRNRTSLIAWSMRGYRFSCRNWVYPIQGRGSSKDSKEPTSMKAGLTPLNWTLYGVPSLRMKPCSMQPTSRSSCVSAVAFNMENDHS